MYTQPLTTQRGHRGIHRGSRSCLTRVRSYPHNYGKQTVSHMEVQQRRLRLGTKRLYERRFVFTLLLMVEVVPSKGAMYFSKISRPKWETALPLSIPIIQNTENGRYKQYRKDVAE